MTTPAIAHLRDCLADPECADWRCPQCNRFNAKGFRHTLTGEHIPFGRTCDECGFDAAPYQPSES